MSAIWHQNLRDFEDACVYLLKDRAQVPELSISFFHEMKPQISTSIRVSHTNNVIEYAKEVSNFEASNGILRQTFCPRTSQENGWLNENLDIFRCEPNFDDSYKCSHVSLV